MIVQENFLSKLREFGLNSYESKLWAALLSRGSSTAGELSDMANVPRSRAYDVLESLERKGFILRKLGKPIKYIAVPPEEVLDRVKLRVKSDAEKHLMTIENLKESELLEELSLLHSKGTDLIEPDELTGVITGRGNIYNHLESRVSKASSSVVILATPSGLMKKAEFLLPLFKKLRKKGVSVRIATHNLKEARVIVDQLSQYSEIRQSNFEGRFCIIDNSEVTFMLQHDSVVPQNYDMVIWINLPFCSKAIA